MKRNNGWRRGVLFLAILSLLAPMWSFALPMTAVRGVVYRADGSTARGTLLVSWPTFVASDGSAIAAGTTTAVIANDGSVSMSLTPNTGATPQGTYYTVVYHLNDGTVSTEYWVVPQAATATISQMRSRVVPAAVAQQTVSQQYVDSSISAIQANYLPLQGGTMSGVLNLSGNPADPMQAATKQYVDNSLGGLNLGSAATHAVSDFDLAGSAAAAKVAAEAFALPISGGTMNGPLNLSSDPVNAMQAATKEYVDAHAGANLPANAIPFQGGTGTAPVAATPANIAAPFTSTKYGNGSYTVLQTTFVEASSGATLTGTTPATEASRNAWVTWVSVGSATYAGNNVSVARSNGNAINTNLNDYTVTFSGVTNTASMYYVVRFSNTLSSGYLAVKTLGSGGVSLLEINSGTTTTVGTSAVANGATGSIVIVVAGNSVTVTPFGGTQIVYTIPSSHQALTGSYVGFINVGTPTQTIGGLAIQAAGIAPSAVPCAGFLSSDGSCSTSGANAMAATDGNGHFTTLPEKGTITSNQNGGPVAPVTTIAWQDDFSAGVYDPRDPRWGPQDTKAHQAAALQTMSNQMACDLSMGKVSQAVAKLPQGAFAVDNLLAAPGSQWIGSPLADGGTELYTFVNNHTAITMPGSMTVTCSDGQQHTDSAGLGMISHFLAQGCATGGCTNAAGDTATYNNGGPGNTGVYLGTNGTLDHIFAQNFGGEGIVMNSQDAKAFHLRTIANLQWYYYGGYKGVGESAASAETSAVTTGTTGSVALSWAAVTNATGYVVYRGTAAGGENNSFLVTTNSFTDTCAAGNTGAVGTVTNVVTETTAATPGMITATPSSTGGTCTAGTYYYKVTATTADGWHGSMRLGGLDTMVDWAESYGQFDAPTRFTFHHLADILTGGGYGHFDHLWPQLGLVGIAQPYGYGTNDHIENFRVDFARQEGIWTHDTAVYFSNGIVDGSCTASNAVTINTGQDDPHFAGLCTQFLSTGVGNNLDNVWFGDNPGFGATVKTADILMEDGSSTVQNTNGSIQYISGLGMTGGGRWWAQTTATTGVTGATPSIRGVDNINPADTTPVTETGFTYGQTGQIFYVWGGNANVTIQSNSSITTCNGQNINLGSVKGPLQFRVSGSGVFTTTAQVVQVCPGPPTLASSETVGFSATPTFSTATRASIITLAGNVSSFTLAAASDGQEKTLTFCQNATGGYTVTAPTNVRGFMTVGTSASKCSSQHFTYSASQSAWIADSAGVTNE